MKRSNDFSNSSEYYDIILGKDKYEKYAKFVEKLLKKYNVKSILELGCGSGLYLFPLKKAKFDIEGLDISKKMLAIARKRSKSIALYEEDMSKFKINKKYGGIICMNSSLVMLSNIKLIEKTIKNCYNHLNEKGILILDIPNHKVEVKENNFSQSYEQYNTDNKIIDVIFRDCKKGDKWATDWIGFVKDGNKFSQFKEYYEELIIDVKKFEKMLENSGFELINLYGTKRGGKFEENKSYRRFYVLKKK